MPAVDKSLPDVQQTDLIGCCGFYNRCSAVLHCVADSETASRCIYRKTLESGVSYYGKTAVSFNAKDYNRLLSAYQSLSDSDREAFSQIIYAFVLKKRLAKKILFYLSDVPDCLVDSNLILIDTDPSEILQSFNYRYLQSQISKLPRTKESGIQKLCTDYPDFVSAETSRFVYVSLPESFNLYDELFQNVFPKNFVFTLSFPEDNEICFVQQR